MDFSASGRCFLIPSSSEQRYARSMSGCRPYFDDQGDEGLINRQIQEDLIICVTLQTLYRRRRPLIFDDFRASSMASQNRLRFTWRFGAILVVLGNQNQCPNSILEPFFFDVMFESVLTSKFGRFLEAQNQKNSNFPMEKQ